MSESCPVCSSELRQPFVEWHYACKNCGYEKSSLEPKINVEALHNDIDESSRESGLKSLRVDNFNYLIDRLGRHAEGKSRKLLDVGAAHGWFLDAAQTHYTVLGLEPDEFIYKNTKAKGKNIVFGYFPEALDKAEKFDIIVFNDVIEHIPDIKYIIEQCHEKLNPGGVLLLNLPNSSGVFYKLSKLFYKIGMKGFFERMWQKGMPSPHVHYFSPQNLKKILENHGFSQLEQGYLPSIKVAGLWERISYAKKHNIVIYLFIYLSVLLALPLLKIFQSDIFYSISRRS